VGCAAKQALKGNQVAQAALAQHYQEYSPTSESFPHIIRSWQILAPFAISRTEFDALPPYPNTSQSVRSAYVGGKVKWKSITASPDGTLDVRLLVDWQRIVQGTSSQTALEIQGWLRAVFPVSEKSTIIVHCAGVLRLHIGNHTLVGDIYNNGFRTSVTLNPGLHLIKLHVRTVVSTRVRCTFEKSTQQSAFVVEKTPYVPDLVDFKLVSSWISVKVSNYWSKPLRLLTADGNNVDVDITDTFFIYPGQTSYLPLGLTQTQDFTCNTKTKLTLTATDGVDSFTSSVTLTYECRKMFGQSFIFTFLAHDGTVSHASAIGPTKSCEDSGCPVVLAFHGTGVAVRNMADAFKIKKKDGFIFGFRKAWLLCPTRFGAHNWEQTGFRTAYASVHALSDLVRRLELESKEVDVDKILSVGHSMGGHGSLHFALHVPDKVIGVAPGSMWIKKEYYSDSNRIFDHDWSMNYLPTKLKYILEAAVAENYADLYLPNIAGKRALFRVGADDKTVHPWYAKRTARALAEWEAELEIVPSLVEVNEVEGKEHWWWDTNSENDGGVLNDKLMRNFYGKCLRKPIGCSSKFKIVTYNPRSLLAPVRGIQILQLGVPFQMATIDGEIDEGVMKLTIRNVRRFSTIQSWENAIVNGNEMKLEVGKEYCFISQKWTKCDTLVHQSLERKPEQYGPIRNVFDHQFLIVVDPNSPIEVEVGTYIANIHAYAYHTMASIITYDDLINENIREFNLILIGKHGQTAYEPKVALSEDSFAGCNLIVPGSAHIILSPSEGNRVILYVGASDEEGYQTLMHFATPAIPPMVRNTFSNLVPDFVVLNSDASWKGLGGIAAAGYFNNIWDVETSMSYFGGCEV